MKYPEGTMQTTYSSQLTQILINIGNGERRYVDKLLPLVYGEFRKIAGQYMQRESPEHTFQSTDLVHEAYLKLVDQKKMNWKSRSHFFAIGAIAMRRILVDHAKSKKRQKRGGDWQRISLDDGLPLSMQRDSDLLALDEVLTDLAKFDPKQAKLVELRFFGGLSNKEIAEVLETSTSTIKREWRVARSWLMKELLNKQ